jgi:hypothetical protein
VTNIKVCFFNKTSDVIYTGIHPLYAKLFYYSPWTILKSNTVVYFGTTPVVPVCCVVVVVPFCCVVVVCSFALSFSVVSGDVADVIPGRMPVDVSVIMSDVMSVGVVMVEELTDSAFNTSKVQIQSNLV